MNREVKITLRDGATITASGRPFMVSGHEFIATRVDNRGGPGAFDSQMAMHKEGANAGASA